jgi:hypothetical protein
MVARWLPFFLSAGPKEPPMIELKTLSHEAIARSLEKAERYRLLNEPEEAESICLDVLRVEPGNQYALVTLLLALTDQFAHGAAECVRQAQEVLPRLEGEYERAYYAGIIYERGGNAHLSRGDLGSGRIAYDWYRRAMEWYDKAEALRPPGNEDAILRWNTCARQIMRHRLEPAGEEIAEPMLQE